MIEKLEFEWDENKEKTNLKKHKVDFETAAHVFYDCNRVILFDEKHSTDDEERYVAIGRVENRLIILYVAFTLRESIIRIISARKVTKREEDIYYDGKENY